MNIKRENLLKEIGYNKSLNEITEKQWDDISKNIELSEDFIIEFELYINWDHVTLCQELTERVISECEYLIDWDILCERKVLSEEFIEKHSDNLTWEMISAYQNLSDEFLIKHKEKINWIWYFTDKQASYEITKKFITKTHSRSTDHFNSSGLTQIQKNEINKLLNLKYMFK
jgi:hypothetical protein